MRRLLYLALASSLTACIVNTTPDESQTNENLVTHNMLAANMLAANMLAANMLAANMLAANDLNSNTLALNGSSANELLATSDGRTVLTYLVSCALPAGTTLVAPDSTEFFGEIGLAPSWLKKPLDPSGAQWVSACVYSRCNALGVAVPISIRGSNNALVTDPSEKNDYTVQDGGFYGNLFVAGAAQPEWLACSGTDNAEAFTLGRECATPDPGNPGKTYCGFTYTGDCLASKGHRAAHAADRGACETFNNGGTYYSACHSYPDLRLNSTGNNARDSVFNPVITAYAHP